MNLKQAQDKIAEISRSTGTKHQKVLISELCAVMKFMLDELGSTKNPPTQMLGQPICPQKKIDIPSIKVDPNKHFPKPYGPPTYGE